MRPPLRRSCQGCADRKSDGQGASLQLQFGRGAAALVNHDSHRLPAGFCSAVAVAAGPLRAMGDASALLASIPVARVRHGGRSCPCSRFVARGVPIAPASARPSSRRAAPRARCNCRAYSDRRDRRTHDRQPSVRLRGTITEDTAVFLPETATSANMRNRSSPLGFGTSMRTLAVRVSAPPAGRCN